MLLLHHYLKSLEIKGCTFYSTRWDAFKTMEYFSHWIHEHVQYHFLKLMLGLFEPLGPRHTIHLFTSNRGWGHINQHPYRLSLNSASTNSIGECVLNEFKLWTSGPDPGITFSNFDLYQQTLAWVGTEASQFEKTSPFYTRILHLSNSLLFEYCPILC